MVLFNQDSGRTSIYHRKDLINSGKIDNNINYRDYFAALIGDDKYNPNLTIIFQLAMFNERLALAFFKCIVPHFDMIPGYSRKNASMSLLTLATSYESIAIEFLKADNLKFIFSPEQIVQLCLVHYAFAVGFITSEMQRKKIAMTEFKGLIHSVDKSVFTRALYIDATLTADTNHFLNNAQYIEIAKKHKLIAPLIKTYLLEKNIQDYLTLCLFHENIAREFAEDPKFKDQTIKVLIPLGQKYPFIVSKLLTDFKIHVRKFDLDVIAMLATPQHNKVAAQIWGQYQYKLQPVDMVSCAVVNIDVCFEVMEMHGAKKDFFTIEQLEILSHQLLEAGRNNIVQDPDIAEKCFRLIPPQSYKHHGLAYEELGNMALNKSSEIPRKMKGEEFTKEEKAKINEHSIAALRYWEISLWSYGKAKDKEKSSTLESSYRRLAERVKLHQEKKSVIQERTKDFLQTQKFFMAKHHKKSQVSDVQQNPENVAEVKAEVVELRRRPRAASV